jgi:hypothetical protein
MCKAVHCKKAPKGTFKYVGRPSLFGNPFNLVDASSATERQSVIDSFAQYFHDRVESDQEFKQAVLSLKGSDLGCWCAPKPCHADVLLRWLEDK